MENSWTPIYKLGNSHVDSLRLLLQIKNVSAMVTDTDTEVYNPGLLRQQGNAVTQRQRRTLGSHVN